MAAMLEALSDVVVDQEESLVCRQTCFLPFATRILDFINSLFFKVIGPCAADASGQWWLIDPTLKLEFFLGCMIARTWWEGTLTKAKEAWDAWPSFKACFNAICRPSIVYVCITPEPPIPIVPTVPSVPTCDTDNDIVARCPINGEPCAAMQSDPDAMELWEMALIHGAASAIDIIAIDAQLGICAAWKVLMCVCHGNPVPPPPNAEWRTKACEYVGGMLIDSCTQCRLDNANNPEVCCPSCAQLPPEPPMAQPGGLSYDLPVVRPLDR